MCQFNMSNLVKLIALIDDRSREEVIFAGNRPVIRLSGDIVEIPQRMGLPEVFRAVLCGYGPIRSGERHHADDFCDDRFRQVHIISLFPVLLYAHIDSMGAECFENTGTEHFHISGGGKPPFCSSLPIGNDKDKILLSSLCEWLKNKFQDRGSLPFNDILVYYSLCGYSRGEITRAVTLLLSMGICRGSYNKEINDPAYHPSVILIEPTPPGSLANMGQQHEFPDIFAAAFFLSDHILHTPCIIRLYGKEHVYELDTGLTDIEKFNAMNTRFTEELLSVKWPVTIDVSDKPGELIPPDIIDHKLHIFGAIKNSPLELFMKFNYYPCEDYLFIMRGYDEKKIYACRFFGVDRLDLEIMAMLRIKNLTMAELNTNLQCCYSPGEIYRSLVALVIAGAAGISGLPHYQTNVMHDIFIRPYPNKN